VTVHVARNGFWLDGRLTLPDGSNASAAFAADGSALFAINAETMEESTLVRATLSATGLAETQRTLVAGAGRLSTYPGRVIAGRQVYSAEAGMALVGTVADAMVNSCVPLFHARKIICQDSSSARVLVADAQSLAKLDSASYNHDSMSYGVNLVPGPPGILAVAEYRRLVVFASDILN